MGKVMRHTLGASLNIRHNLSSSKGPKPLQLKLLTHVFFCVSKNVSVSCAYTQGKREQFSGFNRTLDAINNVFRKFSAFHDETGRLNVDGMNIISNDGSNKLNRSRKARVSYKVQRTINASLNELNRGQSGLETYGFSVTCLMISYLLVVEQHRTQIVIHALLKCQQENLYHHHNVTNTQTPHTRTSQPY